jgi:hypothetical protein
MALRGKGFMIWKIRSCEGGNASAIASAAQAAGLTHVLIKIADGINPYNIDAAQSVDLVPPVVQTLKAYGIQAWGWHYVYGDDPLGEARIAISRVQQLGLDGYVIDAETEYEKPGRSDNATAFMTELRRSLPNTPIALSSFRYPNVHPQLPWKAFLDRCDLNMPQVYWVSAHDSGAQLTKCLQQFQAIIPFRPIFPTGPVCRISGWEPTPQEIVEFMNTAYSLNMGGINYFAWDYRTLLPNLWNSISSYQWGNQPPVQDLPVQYINSLNSHNPDQVTSLYKSNAVHITAAQTIQGSAAIRTWFSTFLSQTLPNATFTLTGTSGTGSSRHFTWQATSSAGQVKNGNDTIGIVDGKIAYHYCYFKVTH